MNIFDADHQNDLGGLFDKIKKAVKESIKNPIKAIKKGPLSAQITKKATKDSISTTQKVRTVLHHAKSVAEKKTHKLVLGNKLGKKVDDFKASKEFQGVKKVVATAVGTYIGGPLVGKALGAGLTAAGATAAGSFVAAQGAAMGAGSLATSIGRSLVGSGAKILVENRLDSQIKAKNEKLQAEYEAQYSRDIENVLALSNDPDMQSRIIVMLESGMTPEQVRKEWTNSQTFATIARSESAATALPLAVDALVNRGVPVDTAVKIGEQITDNLAKEEIGAARGGNLLIPLALAALSFLG